MLSGSGSVSASLRALPYAARLGETRKAPCTWWSTSGVSSSSARRSRAAPASPAGEVVISDGPAEAESLAQLVGVEVGEGGALVAADGEQGG